jgi:hypothetical protein
MWSTRRTSRRAERLVKDKGSVIMALERHTTDAGSGADGNITCRG